MSSVAIRHAAPDDASAICAIYKPYVASTNISFEEALARCFTAPYWELRLQE